jgi:hypothetical protein
MILTKNDNVHDKINTILKNYMRDQTFDHVHTNVSDKIADNAHDIINTHDR